MSSQRRINSSRANGQLSRGPNTDAGKRRSAQNARTHGLLASTLQPSPESLQRFTAAREEFTAAYQPQDEIDRSLIDRMAFFHSRHYEAMAKETALVNEEIRAQPEERPEIAHKEPAVRAFLAISDLSSRSRALEVLHRQASAASLRYEKAFDTLMSRRNSRFCQTNLLDVSFTERAAGNR